MHPLLHRIRQKIWKEVRRPFCRFAPASPVPVFHHIPKCGGTSVIDILRDWFITIEDYRTSWTTQHPPLKDLRPLRSCNCLCGHFELEGVHLHQRYPDVLASPRYKIFTFIRDPLQLQLSLFRYERKHNVRSITLEEHLRLRPNYIASILPATADNYREVLDRYFFVGILEERQLSLDVLAVLLGKPRKKFPWINRTRDTSDSPGRPTPLSDEVVTRFKHDNELDYRIYEYCVERFRRQVDSLADKLPVD